MPKRVNKDEQFKLRITAAERRKLDKLAARFGTSRATIWRMGLMRLYEVEFGPDPASAKTKKT
jgi:hypothetical protein